MTPQNPVVVTVEEAAFHSALSQIGSRLLGWARSDESRRTELLTLVRTLAEALSVPVAGVPTLPAVPSAAAVAAPPAEPVRTPVPVEAAPLPKLDIGSAAPRQLSDYSEHLGSIPEPAALDDAELPQIEARARLKAEGARWQIRRRELNDLRADFQADIAPTDRDIIQRARALPECFLWMCNPSGPTATDDQWNQVSLAFDTLADAIALVRKAKDLARPNDLESILPMLAEAQSALRVICETLIDADDLDQYRTYHWLKRITRQENIYIRNFMVLDEPADPAGLSDLADRIQQFTEQLDTRANAARESRNALRKINYHVKAIRENRGKDSDWNTIVQTTTRLIAELGVRPSDTELRELLLPVIDQLPESLGTTPSFDLVLREIDTHLADREVPTRPTGAEKVDPAIEQVRAHLQGRTMVLIGGSQRRFALENLVSAFGLKDLDWVSTREHAPIAPFEHHVARPDVAVVLLAIRWSSHSFEGVSDFCEKHGKPLVRLPGGYNPRQVAEQILKQVEGQLSAPNP